ncbi:MAG: LytR C-terminal domain-containing protein, partial [Solirubrobacteraceae bacterium]
AVLNSTPTAHLASTVMGRLAARGYRQGAVTNAPDQPLTSTIVGYSKPSYRADALAVAKALSLGQASVQSVSQNDLGTACPSSSGPCPTKVVVTLGSDLASGG